MNHQAKFNAGYEFYQIITDFTEPLEIFREAFQNSVDEEATRVFCRVEEIEHLGKADLIIDIWDNGVGLSKEDADAFVGLAMSTKTDANGVRNPGKLGYKGHGTKIFFNSEQVEVLSIKDGVPWALKIDDAVSQIRSSKSFTYEFIEVDSLTFKLPAEFKSGFWIRIKNPKYFQTQHTRFKLNHLAIRDYCKWFTVFGSIRPLFDEDLKKKDIKLFLRGLSLIDFEKRYGQPEILDPKPIFETCDNIKYEVLSLGHYFPEQRTTDKDMKKYAEAIKSNKPYYDFYSINLECDTFACHNNISFNLVCNLEGLQTKRRYDPLLSSRGNSNISRNLLHTDAERYGIWACKGGVPIERVDHWVEGSRGVGTFTYMHAFVDCDRFELTANRSSINNTDLEIIDIVRSKVSEIINQSKNQKAIKDRAEWENLEKKITNIAEDENRLKQRYKEVSRRSKVILQNGKEYLEPSKNKSGYSESETMILLINLLNNYPDLFPYDLLDYNTTNGIDFIVEHMSTPKYVELKGTLNKSINHSFRHMYKIICYDIAVREHDEITDDEFNVVFTVNKEDKFESRNKDFKGKQYRSYSLIPKNATIQSIEVIVLKHLIEDILHGSIR